MTSTNHSNNLSFVTLYFLSSTPPPSSTASSSSTSSTSWTKKISEKIEELKKQLESLNNLKNAQNGYLPDQDSKSLDSLPTQLTSLETVHKLAEFADHLDTNKYNNNNILNNLCTGLETFLGFNSASKGYDGSGIVYSDLDRLCDGVMAFLSGVLDAVKNENDVTTYDKDTSKDINTVIKTLNDKIGSGRKGLAASVEQVKEWLEGYDEKLQEKTSHVINDLGKLRDDISGIYTANISAGDNLQEQLSKWTSAVGDIDKYLSNTEKQYVNKLDSVLDKNIMHEIKPVQKVVNHLKSVAENDIVTQQAKVVDAVLVNQKERIEKEIKEGFIDLQKQLAYKFRCIDKKIIDLREIKRTQLGNVKHVIQDGKSKAQGMFVEFDNKYATPILQHFENIKSALAEVDKSNNPSGNRDASKLREEIEGFKQSMGAATMKLHKHVVEMQAWANDTKTFIDSIAQDHVDEIINGKVGNDIKKQIDITARSVETESRILHGQFNAKKNELQIAVDAIRKASTQLGDPTTLKRKVKVPGNLSGFKNNGWDLNDKISAVTSTVTSNIQEYVKTLGAALEAGITGAGRFTIGVSTNGGVRALKDAFAQKGDLKGDFKDLVNLNKVLEQAASGNNNELGRCINNVFMWLNEVQSKLKSAAENLPKPVELLEEFQRALSNIATSNIDEPKLEDLITSAVDKGMDELQRKINQDIVSGLLDTVSKNVDAFDGEASAAEGELRKHATTVKSKLDEYLAAFAAAGKDIKEVLQLLKADAIDNRFLTGITRHLNTLQAKNYEEITKATNALHSIITSLEGLPDVVEYKMADVVEKMKALREHVELIYSHFQHIEFIATTANDKIEKAIKGTQTTLSDAYASAETLVEALRNNLLAISADAFRTVTNEVRTLFADGHIADLQALQKLITTQLKIINCTINKNLNTGLKGFLKTLSGNHIDEYAAGHDMDRRVKKPSTRNLLDPVKRALDGDRKHGEKVAALSEKSQAYFIHIFDYLRKDMEKHFASQPKVIGDYPKRISTIQRNLTGLLTHITTQKHIDHQVPEKLETLKTSVTTFKSSHFGNASYPVLDAFPQSLLQFLGELERMYVSRYEGGEGFDCNLVDAKYELRPLKEPETVYTLTDKGRKAAKIFLTLFNTVYEDISRLNDKCESDWRGKSLCKIHENADNPLGLFLQRCGYAVAENQDSKDGELKLPMNDFKGRKIHEQLNHHTLSSGEVFKHLLVCESNYDEKKKGPKKERDFDVCDILNCLLEHVHKYNEICHLSTLTSQRHPCSVYEMLVWLSGLPHSPVHASQLSVSILEYFEDPNENKDETDGPVLMTDVNLESLVRYAHPRNITWYGITEAIEHLCSKSYDVITAIAGTGDAETIYGSDLCNNSMKFHYPQSGEDCLQMIIDVLRRLFPPLRFLVTQCSVGASHNGWLRCTYGRDVQPASWPCKDHPTDKSKCQPTCPPKCQPKSPLMSYLNDCHVGCLPHRVTSIGCKSVCLTCPGNKPGMPCLTPLGFRGFSGSMKTGRDLCNVLAKFFGNPYLSALISLAPTPPSTLPEHFTFTLSLVTGWNNSYLNEQMTLKKKVASSIATESMDLYDNTFELTDAIDNAYGNCTSNDSECTDAHLISLTSSGTCKNKTLNCAPYLQSLCADSYNYLAYNNSKTYLTWALYLPWNFHKYLEALLTAFKDIFCSDWGCGSCLNGKCKRGEHGAEDKICRCSSFVKCNGVMPTLYKYGFTFHDAPTLDARKFPMTCFDFQTLLFKVTRSNYFTVLFDKCDEFLFKIRAPFIWLNVALWLLSLLYLIHIMVIRLDLLHIKSHLHGPSSHRIAAQSLLAAARVNKLNRVFYLQP